MWDFEASRNKLKTNILGNIKIQNTYKRALVVEQEYRILRRVSKMTEFRQFKCQRRPLYSPYIGIRAFCRQVTFYVSHTESDVM